MKNWEIINNKACEARDRRRQHILDLLKQGELSVMDIKQKMPHYNAKTIHNDLSIMSGWDAPPVTKRHASNGHGRIAVYRLTGFVPEKSESLDPRLAAFMGIAVRPASRGKVFIADDHEELFKDIIHSQTYKYEYRGIASNHSVLEMAA